MRLKLRDVTFVGTVALWVEAQALCERAPSLISSPYTWIVTDIILRRLRALCTPVF
jgi:hypothetical protein